MEASALCLWLILRLTFSEALIFKGGNQIIWNRDNVGYLYFVTRMWRKYQHQSTEHASRWATKVPEHTKKMTTKDCGLDQVPWMCQDTQRSLHLAYSEGRLRGNLIIRCEYIPF